MQNIYKIRELKYDNEKSTQRRMFSSTRYTFPLRYSPWTTLDYRYPAGVASRFRHMLLLP